MEGFISKALEQVSLKIQRLRKLRREGFPERLSRSWRLAEGERPVSESEHCICSSNYTRTKRLTFLNFCTYNRFIKENILLTEEYYGLRKRITETS